MIFYGPNIEVQSSSSISQPILIISQLLMYNSLVRCRKNQTIGNIRHSRERETPLPPYLGVMLHTKTHKRELVETLYDLGLSVSYDRVMNISTELGNKMCSLYHWEKAVCPPELKSGLFTTAAVDNIDHNPSSTSSHGAFHGTGISLFQHPDCHNGGVPRLVTVPSDNATRYAHLPESYTSILAIALAKDERPLPVQEGPNAVECTLIPHAMEN